MNVSFSPVEKRTRKKSKDLLRKKALEEEVQAFIEDWEEKTMKSDKT